MVDVYTYSSLCELVAIGHHHYRLLMVIYRQLSASLQEKHTHGSHESYGINDNDDQNHK